MKLKVVLGFELARCILIQPLLIVVIESATPLDPIGVNALHLTPQVMRSLLTWSPVKKYHEFGSAAYIMHSSSALRLWILYRRRLVRYDEDLLKKQVLFNEGRPSFETFIVNYVDIIVFMGSQCFPVFILGSIQYPDIKSAFL